MDSEPRDGKEGTSGQYCIPRESEGWHWGCHSLRKTPSTKGKDCPSTWQCQMTGRMQRFPTVEAQLVGTGLRAHCYKDMLAQSVPPRAQLRLVLVLGSQQLTPVGIALN